MPASSLFPVINGLDMNSGVSSNPSSVVGGGSSNVSNGSNSTFDENRTVQLALELALLQGGSNNGEPQQNLLVQQQLQQQQHQQMNQLNHINGTNGHHGGNILTENPILLNGFGSSGSGVNTGSLEDLKSGRRSQNMTECVPVPTSEHVAEIVGRQGCKIKALRAKTNTYIKTPVRGEEPVFVVTGRKEDVALAKREILSAADHFSQIRASRTKNNVNSTLAFGQLVTNQPGQTTVQVRVPCRVVGLVVGPKGATIKRIQQQTHTYIVTPSRDKEPVFEVTGMPENVDAARKEIEAHIALRTGHDGGGSGNNSGSLYGNLSEAFGNGGIGEQDFSSNNVGFQSALSSSSGHLDHLGNNSTHSQAKFGSILNGGSNGLDSAFSSLTSTSSGGKGITLQNILDSNNFGDLGGGNSNHSHASSSSSRGNLGMVGHHQNHHQAWSNNGGTDSHGSGVGHSPPFEANGHHPLEPSLSAGANAGGQAMNGIWGDLGKILGGLDINADLPAASAAQAGRPFVGSRSSLDLGVLGRPDVLDSCSNASSTSSSQPQNPTAVTSSSSALLMSSTAAEPTSNSSFLLHHRSSVSSEPSTSTAAMAAAVASYSAAVANSEALANEVAIVAFNSEDEEEGGAHQD